MHLDKPRESTILNDVHHRLFFLPHCFCCSPAKRFCTTCPRVCCLILPSLFLFCFYFFSLSFLLPAGLNNLKVNVTHRMNSTTFAAIIKLGSGLKKKAKKKKGKPGKVRIQLSNYNRSLSRLATFTLPIILLVFAQKLGKRVVFSVFWVL